MVVPSMKKHGTPENRKGTIMYDELIKRLKRLTQREEELRRHL